MTTITTILGITLFDRFLEGGAFLGLISAFDVLEASGAAEPAIIAGGLKVALLSPLFGLFTFSVSKLAILILRIIQK